MRLRISVLSILFVVPVLAFSQSVSPKTMQIAWQANRQDSQVTISGCLAKSKRGDYELVDPKGVRTIVYKSEAVDLEPHVGQSVSLTGRKSVTPSTDTGTSRPKAHFVVLSLQEGTGKCGKK